MGKRSADAEKLRVRRGGCRLLLRLEDAELHLLPDELSGIPSEGGHELAEGGLGASRRVVHRKPRAWARACPSPEGRAELLRKRPPMSPSANDAPRKIAGSRRAKASNSPMTSPIVCSRK